MTTYEGKAVAAKMIQDRTYVKESLVLCDCAWPMMDSFNTPDHVGDPSLESKLFTAVTGHETDETELSLYGERMFNLQRGVLLREGWQALKDDVPAEVNFTNPVEFDLLNPQLLVPGPGEEPVSVKGNILDRKEYEKMRGEFYGLRGWDSKTGLQKAETLERLGLNDLKEALRKEGLLN
jgi:aldehyde:ferredoxin oxidoreductase